MGGLSMDMVEQRTVMNPDVSSVSPTADVNFAFAFNDSNFSDRLLRIEITAGLDDVQSYPDGCSSIADWARQRKRRREDFNKDGGVGDQTCCSEEQILDCNQPDIDDEIGFGIQDEEPVAMIEESPSGDEEDNNSVDSNWGMDCSTVMRVTTLHISSPILAAKSPFFYKLFSNGMRESEQRHVTIRISASEESSFIALLNFMYSNHIPSTTPSDLLDLLMAADKFEVASCMRYCSKLLRDLPMTPESALLFLDLPSGVLMAEAVQPLTDAAKQYLSARYQDLSKSYDGVMALPLAGIEAVLSSDNLIVGTEDVVYDFVLKWAKVHYPNPEVRRDILGSRLSRFIRFPQMSPRKLKKVQTCPDFDPVLLSKLVMDALFFKTETLHRQQILASEESVVPNCRFMKRNYKYRPVRTVEIEHPRPQVLAFLNLQRWECKKLEETSGRVYSESFPLDGQGFFLSAHYNRDQAGTFPCFGLFLGMQQKGLDRCVVDYEFAAREKPSEAFERKYKGSYTFSGGKAVGYRNLFGMPWDEFISEGSPCFINDTLFLRAELIVVTPPAAICGSRS